MNKDTLIEYAQGYDAYVALKTTRVCNRKNFDRWLKAHHNITNNAFSQLLWEVYRERYINAVCEVMK